MKRNSTTLFLETPGSITLIPWVNGAPDFSIYSEPTLSIFRSVWQAFLNSGEELEIIPDPEPFVELPPAQWTAFNFALFTDADFVNYGKTANQVNPFFVPALVERYGRIVLDGLQESNFAAYWQSFCLAFDVSAEHRNEWATLAKRFDLPEDFISVIRG